MGQIYALLATCTTIRLYPLQLCRTWRLSAPATDAASLRTDGSRDLIADQPREIRRKSVCHLAGGNDPVSRRLQPIRGRRTHLEFATERLTATVTAMREPAPGTLSTRKLPPSASTRSRMPVMP